MKRTKVVAICVAVVSICVPSAQADGASGRSVAALLPFEAHADDGVVLRGHVYLPDGEGPFGTVLEYSPYWNTNGGYGQSDGMIVEQDGRETLGLWLGRYLEVGFAVALVNIRGSGESDGCFQFGLPRDWSDVYTVVETLADQPWSNGKIGMIGLSYPGWTQYMALASKPPSLKAVIPVSGVIDPWNLWGRHGASARTDLTYSPVQHTVFAGTSTTGVLAMTGPFVPDTHVSHVTCPDYVEDSFHNAVFGVRGDRTQYWRTQDLRPHIAGTTVPTLFANGLGRDGHILQFDDLWGLLEGPKRMLIGQWGHENPDEAGYAVFEEMTVAWMDRYLRDGPEVVEPGVVDYQDDTGVWNTADQWPPSGTRVSLYLSDGSLVASRDEVDQSSVTFTSVMQDPQPDNCPGMTSVYVSPPLAHDVLLAGNYEADITVSSTMPDGNLGILLYHREEIRDCVTEALPNWFTEPGGRIGQALTDLRHARGNEGGSPFPIGEPTAVHAMSHPFASRVRAGERLVLSIGGGANELQPDSTTSILTVTTGPGHVGEVSITVIEGELAFVG